jgi:DNA replication protein DnaC
MKKEVSMPLKRKKEPVTPLCAPELFKKVFFKTAQIFYAENDLDFGVDIDNKNFLGHFCRYWNREVAFEMMENISLKKGLLVFGSYGTGKTTSFKIIQNLAKHYQVRELWFPSISAQEVVDRFNMEKNKEEVIRYYSKGTFLFDDLGSETAGNNIYQYGKEDVFVRILLNRYRNFENLGTKTHITTNLSQKQMEERYGKQLADRFVEMFNLLKLDGPSRRK